MLTMPANSTVAFFLLQHVQWQMAKAAPVHGCPLFRKRNRDVHGVCGLRRTQSRVMRLSSRRTRQNENEGIQYLIQIHGHWTQMYTCHTMPKIKFAMWKQLDVNTHTHSLMHWQGNKHLHANQPCVSHQQLCHISTTITYMQCTCWVVHIKFS